MPLFIWDVKTLSPNMIGLFQLNHRIFLLRELGVAWVYIDLPGVVFWQHIHTSTLYSYWEEGWEDSKAWESFVSLSLDWIPQVPIAGNHRLSLLVHHSSLHHHLVGSIHLKLLSCWVESTQLFAARVVDSREYGNRTRELQSGDQSSYWLWTSVFKWTRTGVTHSPPHPTRCKNSVFDLIILLQICMMLR